MRAELGVNPDPEVDVYLRLSRVGGGRYGVDLWLKRPKRHWSVERELPETAVRYVTQVLRDTYYQPYADALRELAEELWAAFMPDDLRSALEGYLTPERVEGLRRWAVGVFGDKVGKGAEKRIRIELRDPMLHYLPWEYLPVGEWLPQVLVAYPARFTPPDSDLGALRIDLPLRVLFVAASPSMSKMAINVSAEYDRMAQALEEIAPGRIELVPLLDPDRDALAAELSGSWFHILHVACHGMLAASGPMLALQSRRRSQFLSPAELGALARAGGVRLLTLQTPLTATNYQIAAFAGFAAQGRVLGLPGLLFDLRQDTQRIPTVARVYAGLARGLAVDVACREADRASEEELPVLGLSLHTFDSHLFRIAAPEVMVTPEALESASTALHHLVVDVQSEEHRQLMEMVESGASEGEVADMLTWHVKVGASTPKAVTGAAAEQIGKAVARQVVKKPQQFAKGLDLRNLPEVARADRQQALQELDYVHGNLVQLEEMRAATKSPPAWLEGELTAQRERLAQLHDELEGEA